MTEAVPSKRRLKAVEEMVGNRYGRLEVLGFSHVRGTKTMVSCRCTCGSSAVVQLSEIKRGHTRSCGCLSREASAQRAQGWADQPLTPGLASRNRLLSIYKKGAVTRGLEFSLSTEEFTALTQMDCFYCGDEPSQVVHQTNSPTAYLYNGIDRVDNDKGYVWGNCVPCCGRCNNLKGGVTPDMVERTYKFLTAPLENVGLGEFPAYLQSLKDLQLNTQNLQEKDAA